MDETWTKWARELQFLAQAGLTYSKDPYDLERFQRIRDIAAEMVSHQADIPLGRVKELFCCETGYQTPKLDTRAAVFREGKILLVQERGGLWSLPGGWVDVDQSIRENTEKEVREEAGLEVVAERIIALHDRNRHNTPAFLNGVCKAVNSRPIWRLWTADGLPRTACRPSARTRPRPGRLRCVFAQPEMKTGSRNSTECPYRGQPASGPQSGPEAGCFSDAFIREDAGPAPPRRPGDGG